jgi:hypothetical protein
MNRNTKRVLPAAAIAIALCAGPAMISAAQSGRQQQPPVVQPPSPSTQQPPATQPVPQVQPPAQTPQPTPAPTTQPPTPQPPTTATIGQQETPNQSTPSGGAAVLLDRISDLVDQALGGKPAPKSSNKGTPGAKGTTGVIKVGKTSAGTVTVDRAALDEIKSEVEQLRVMLKDKQR